MLVDEILAMEPGHKLNVLIADKVMGLLKWWVHASDRSIHPGERFLEVEGPWLKRVAAKEADGTEPIYQHGKSAGYAPDYSTDIAAAWEVMEKMLDNGVGLPGVYHDGQLWVATIVVCIKKGVVVSAPTAPEAICKAALLATLEAE